jgi:hypothetical protein
MSKDAEALVPLGWCVVKSGYMHKKGDIHSAWKPRLFQIQAREIHTNEGSSPAVRGAKLKYFDKKNKLKGSILLGPCSRCSVSRNPHMKLHELELETDDRVWRFATDSDEATQSWIDALQPFVSDPVVMTAAGRAFHRRHEQSACTTLHYEGQDGSVEVSIVAVAALVEAGTIHDKTLVYSDRDDFPHAGWVCWGEVCHLFGVGEAREGCQRCSVVNAAGDGSDEYPRAELLRLVESGQITEETLVYSEEANFPHDHWMAWKEVSYLYGIGESPAGGDEGAGGGGALAAGAAAHSPSATFDPKVPTGWLVVKQGFLKKKGDMHRKWSIRYFQLLARERSPADGGARRRFHLVCGPF